MKPDFIVYGGYMTLGSRLRRLGERMQADVQRLAKAEGFDVPSGLIPTVGALSEFGPMTIGELAESLGVAQPGVTRNVMLLARRGLVKKIAVAHDKRSRAVILTAKGQQKFEHTRVELGPRVAAAVASLCDGPATNLLAALTYIEAELELTSIADRARKNSRKNKGG